VIIFDYFFVLRDIFESPTIKSFIFALQTEKENEEENGV